MAAMVYHVLIKGKCLFDAVCGRYKVENVR